MSEQTIIHKLSGALSDNNIYMKREDLLPFSFGGNKARKAKYFFDEILKNNNDAVVTYGSSSSNHCRIIANLAASNSKKCYIISPEEGYEKTSNSKLVELFDAEIIKTPINKVSQTIDSVMNNLLKNGNPYFIMGGGHGNIGTLAYSDAYQEICRYEEENNVRFDYIFHATGTGTTQAGLVCGQISKKNFNQQIIGISIARTLPRGKNVVVESIKEFLNTDDACEKYVNFCDDYICGGYGKYNDDICETIERMLKCDGIALNTTYTGKAFYGMEQYIDKLGIKNKNILFINTGGLPLFFDDMERIRK